MALVKSIMLDNGITVNYHRVVSVNNITNVASIIETASYTDKEKRDEEKTAIKNKEQMNVYIKSAHFPVAYDKNLNVDTAYEYLKTLEEFENSEDDIAVVSKRKKK